MQLRSLVAYACHRIFQQYKVYKGHIPLEFYNRKSCDTSPVYTQLVTRGFVFRSKTSVLEVRVLSPLSPLTFLGSQSLETDLEAVKEGEHLTHSFKTHTSLINDTKAQDTKESVS